MTLTTEQLLALLGGSLALVGALVRWVAMRARQDVDRLEVRAQAAEVGMAELRAQVAHTKSESAQMREKLETLGAQVQSMAGTMGRVEAKLDMLLERRATA